MNSKEELEVEELEEMVEKLEIIIGLLKKRIYLAKSTDWIYKPDKEKVANVLNMSEEKAKELLELIKNEASSRIGTEKPILGMRICDSKNPDMDG